MQSKSLKKKRSEEFDEQLKSKREEYRDENARLRTLFETDLAKEFGLEDHPKKEKLMEIVNDRDYGISLDAYWAYETLSELLK